MFPSGFTGFVRQSLGLRLVRIYPKLQLTGEHDLAGKWPVDFAILRLFP
jgi:hypothetical protein